MASDLKLQVILGAVDKATRPIQHITKQIKSLNQAYGDNKSELKALQAQQRDVTGYRKANIELRNQTRAIRDLQGKSQGLTAALDKQREANVNIKSNLKDARSQYNKLAKAMLDGKASGAEFHRELEKAQIRLLSAQQASDRSSRAIKKYQQEIKSTETRLKALGSSHDITQEKLGRYKQQLSDAGISTDKLGHKSKALRSDEQRLTDALDRQKAQLNQLIGKQDKLNKVRQQGKDLHRAGMGVMAHGVGAAYMGQAAGRQLLKPVSAFSSMETARTDLRVELMDQSGKVGPEFQKIIDLSTNLGNKLPGNTADFINMMTMLKSQGMSTQGILGGLGESAAYLAVRMKLPADEAARFVSVLQENTGTSEKDMFGLVDVIQRLRGVGLEADNLLGVYKNLGPVMQTINRQGLDGATALAPFVAMLDQAGMRGDSAGNAIRKVVNASLNMDKVAKANKLMQKNGLALLDFTDGKGEFGGIDQFMAELNKLKNLDTVARGDVIRELFGDDAETGIALGKIIEQGAEGYQDIVRKLQSQADLRKRVEEQLGTLANLWDAATGTFTNTLAVVGEALAPELKALSRWFGDLSEKIGTLAKENPTLTRVLALLAAGISAVLVIGGGLAATVGLLMMTAGAIKMSAAAGLLLKPVVWVLSGLAKGGLLLAKTALPALLVGFKALGAVILANPVGWLLGAIAAIVLAAGLIYKYWAPIKGFFLGFWQGLASAVGPAIVAFGKALAVLLQFFPIRHVFEGIAGVVGWLWRGFKSLFSPVATVGGEFEKATSIGRAFGQMLGNLVMFFPNLISGFVGLGVSLVDGLIGGITTRLGALKEAIVGVGGKAANWFRAKLGINSPSRVFAEFGVNTVQGYQQGLQRKESAPMKQMEGMVKRLKQAGAGLAMAASAHAMPVPTLPNIGIDAPTLPRSIGIDKPQSATLGLPDLPRMGVDLPPLPRLGIDTPALPRSIGIDKPQSATLGLPDLPRALGVDLPILPRLGIDTPPLPRSIGIDKPQSATLGLPDLPRALGVNLPPLPRLGIDAPVLPAFDTPALDTRGPLTPREQNIQVAGDTITINITAAPGSDAQDLADQINRILDERDNRKAARVRSAFHDID